MATCCTGVTECQQIINIDFLNSFISNDIQDSNGNPVTVVGDSAYCPTYSELTGGTLIQNWREGNSPNGDIDGIVISGSYSGNECVRREDLSVKYTRFDNFNISSTKYSLSACGESSILSYSHSYKRFTKSTDSTCEGTPGISYNTVGDTTDSEVTYISDNNNFTISNGTLTAAVNNPNNNGRSSDRTATISGLITFRGTNHTSNIAITQLGLTGSYVYLATDYTLYNKRVEDCEPTVFGCHGGTYGATAKHDRRSWEILCWEDECGTKYTNDTVEGESTIVTDEIAETYSGIFYDISSEGGDNYDSHSFSGYGSCSWEQHCTPGTCEDYIVYGEVSETRNVPCSGSTVTITKNVPYSAYTSSPDTFGICVDVLSYTSTSAVTITVEVPCNTDTSSKAITGKIKYINYTLNQPAGPCCTPGTVTTYETKRIPCEKTVVNMFASYTSTTTDACCISETHVYNTDSYAISADCNSGAERELTAAQKSNAPFTVIQEGGCQCECSGNCNSLALDSNSVSFGCDNSMKKINYSVDCASSRGIYNVSLGNYDSTNLSVSLTDYTVSGYSTGGYVDVSMVTAVSALPASYSSTITINFDSGTASGCSKTINVTVANTSGDYSINTTHESMTSGDTAIFKDYDININITN